MIRSSAATNWASEPTITRARRASIALTMVSAASSGGSFSFFSISAIRAATSGASAGKRARRAMAVADAAGMETVTPTEVPANSPRKALEKPRTRELGCAIGGLAGNRNQPEQAGKIDDLRFGPRTQHGQEGADHPHRAHGN